MSSNLPPTGPPTGPPSGPPSGPPLGPPQPPFGAPELLDNRSGGWAPPPPAPTQRSGGGRRKGLLAGGAVVGLAAVAGGAFAVYQLGFATGPQPAEALPASTVGYVSLDLDPSGKQKIEGLKTLNKFPAFRDNVDLDSDDDLRKKLVELVVDDAGLCSDLDFDDDIEPWLGDRFGIAAVDVGDELAGDSLGIAPVGVLQVTDADGAEKALTKIQDCVADAFGGEAFGSSEGGEVGGVEGDTASPAPDDSDDSGPEPFGFSVQGDWVVVAASDEVAEAVTDAAADEPLSGDADYQKWTEAAGDPGILTAYLAPDAGTLITEAIGTFGLTTSESCSASAEVTPIDPDDPSAGDEYQYSGEDCTSEPSEGDDPTKAINDAFKDFDGAALTIRFDDGGVDLEAASSLSYLGLDKIAGTDRGGDAVAGLPEDTAIGVGLSFEQGWFTALTDYIESSSGGQFDLDAGIAEIERATGLSLPEDAETLAGESAAIAIGSDIDFSTDGPEGQQLGVKVQGDADAISSVVDKLVGGVQEGELDGFAYQTGDDVVAGGFSDEWTQRLLDDGGLGDTDAYQDVVEESDDAAGVVFVNFNEGDWFERALKSTGDDEVYDNFKELAALGLSAWTDDDDVSHSVLRVTTD